MDYAKKYLKYKDKATQDKFNKLVDEYRIDNALETAIDIALREVRENKKIRRSNRQATRSGRQEIRTTTKTRT